MGRFFCVVLMLVFAVSSHTVKTGPAVYTLTVSNFCSLSSVFPDNLCWNTGYPCNLSNRQFFSHPFIRLYLLFKRQFQCHGDGSFDILLCFDSTRLSLYCQHRGTAPYAARATQRIKCMRRKYPSCKTPKKTL